MPEKKKKKKTSPEEAELAALRAELATELERGKVRARDAERAHSRYEALAAGRVAEWEAEQAEAERRAAAARAAEIAAEAAAKAAAKAAKAAKNAKNAPAKAPPKKQAKPKVKRKVPAEEPEQQAPEEDSPPAPTEIENLELLNDALDDTMKVFSGWQSEVRDELHDALSTSWQHFEGTLRGYKQTCEQLDRHARERGGVLAGALRESLASYGQFWRESGVAVRAVVAGFARQTAALAELHSARLAGATARLVSQTEWARRSAAGFSRCLEEFYARQRARAAEAFAALRGAAAAAAARAKAALAEAQAQQTAQADTLRKLQLQLAAVGPPPAIEAPPEKSAPEKIAAPTGPSTRSLLTEAKLELASLEARSVELETLGRQLQTELYRRKLRGLQQSDRDTQIGLRKLAQARALNDTLRTKGDEPVPVPFDPAPFVRLKQQYIDYFRLNGIMEVL